MHAAKFLADWHTGLPEQAALAEFIGTGGLGRHIRRLRRTYQARHRLLTEALVGPLSRWLELIPSAAGLHVGAWLRDAAGTDAASVVAAARATGVAVFDFSMFSSSPEPPQGLSFGYGAIATGAVAPAISRLRGVLAAGG
jgi:GntR family transcriptional regulator/MocR family aminotransferase